MALPFISWFSTDGALKALMPETETAPSTSDLQSLSVLMHISQTHFTANGNEPQISVPRIEEILALSNKTDFPDPVHLPGFTWKNIKPITGTGGGELGQ